MDPEVIAEAAGEQTAAVVEAALESAEAREEAAAEIVDQVVESARQSEIVNTVEARFSEISSWRGDVEQRLTETQSSLETLLGQLTEMSGALALLTTAAALTSSEPEPTPEPEPEPIPEPQSTLPDAAEDGPRESHAVESKPEHRKSSPKRRFW
jgi:hypothetical protein